MPNGDWVAVFGNGYKSFSNKAMLFIANLSTGALTKINTGAGGSNENGLATPRLVIDATGTIRGAYAGDLLGNLWKFDFKSSGVSVAFSGSALFTAKDGTTPQPITVQPDITAHPEGGTMVTFGTGKLFEKNDAASNAIQAMYGIWDKTGIKGVTPTVVSDATTLVTQTQTSLGSGLTILSNNNVDWATKRGWVIKLAAGERVTIDPAMVYSTVFYTTITPTGATDPCSVSGSSTNWLFNAITGGAINSITFDTNKNGSIDAGDVKASGMTVPLTFGSTILRRKGGIAIVQPSADGGGGPGPGPAIGNANLPPIPALRLWRQILGKN
jgi:type IV pilus assembly protein PilY1